MCKKTTKKKTGYYSDQVVKRFNCCFTKILLSGNTEYCAGLLPRREPTSVNSGTGALKMRGTIHKLATMSFNIVTMTRYKTHFVSFKLRTIL